MINVAPGKGREQFFQLSPREQRSDGKRMAAWKTKKTETLVEDRFCTVKKNSVELPDGAIIPDFYTVTIPDAALVVALTPDNQIILKKEFRYACGTDIIECPAGMVEEGEEPLDTAKRELLEETGYTSDQWTWLGATRESTSKLTNKMWLFMARDCKKVADQKLDLNERMEVLKMPLAEAVDMVMENQICANSSAHAILKAEKTLS